MKSSSLESKDFEKFVEYIWDSVFIVDRNRKIKYWNKALTELTGYKAEETMGQTCELLYAMNLSDTPILCNLSCTCLPQTPHEIQLVLKTKEGISIPVFQRMLPYYANPDQKKNNNPDGCIHIIKKLSGADETAALIHELNYLAYIEPHTQTARRHYGEIILQKSLDAFLNQSTPFGILLMDLDLFKAINDTHGHRVGDHVLVSVVSLIKKNLRPSDLLVRYGGDEFLLISHNSEKRKLKALGKKLCELVSSLDIEHNKQAIPISISIGGALPIADDTVDSILIRADSNMYIAKRTGRNRCNV